MKENKYYAQWAKTDLNSKITGKSVKNLSNTNDFQPKIVKFNNCNEKISNVITLPNDNTSGKNLFT